MSTEEGAPLDVVDAPPVQDPALSTDTTPVDCAESGPLENGADATKAKFDAKEASNSLGNIAPEPWSHQPPPVNDAALSYVVSQSGSWTLLSDRLTTLLGVADQVAEVCWVSLNNSEQSAHCTLPMS